ncbi:hypothetical protein WAI453_007904 [Rhynchosporium graminicola]
MRISPQRLSRNGLGWQFLVACVIRLFFTIALIFEGGKSSLIRSRLGILFLVLFFILALFFTIAILAEICLFANSYLDVNSWGLLAVLDRWVALGSIGEVSGWEREWGTTWLVKRRLGVRYERDGYRRGKGELLFGDEGTFDENKLSIDIMNLASQEIERESSTSQSKYLTVSIAAK